MDTHQETAGTLAERSEKDLRDALAEQEIPAYAVEQLTALLRYAKEQSLGIKALSLASGMPQGVLSQLLNARYPGNYVLRARRVEKFLQELEKRELFAGRDDFVETRVAKGLWTIFEKTRYSRRIQVIQSPEQLGKSRAAHEYAHQNNGGRTIMATLQPGGPSNAFGLFIRDMALATRVADVKNRRAIELRYDLKDALSICDLCIIDEFHLCEHWPDKAVRDLLDFIRVELHADGARGVVLVATNFDAMTFLNQFRRRTRYNLGQLLGRMCNQVLELFPDEIPFEDVEALVGRYGKFRKATLDKLYDIVSRPGLGHYGLLLDVMNRAWTDCKVAGKPISDEVVLEIARDTMDDIGKRKELYA